MIGQRTRRCSSALVAVVLLASTACGGGGGGGTLTVTGTLTLAQSGVALVSRLNIGDACTSDSGGFSDITSGAQVRVTDEKNTLLATAALQDGKIVEDHSGFHNCVFPFTVKVPAGKAFYQFEVSHRGAISFSADDLKSKNNTVALSIG